MTRKIIACWTLALALALTAVGKSGEQASSENNVDAAWNLIWTNHPSEAVDAFARKLAEDENNLSAWRGIAIAQLHSGDDRSAIESALRFAKLDGVNGLDAVLMQWIYGNTVTTGKDEKRFQRALEDLAKRKSIDPVERRVILARAQHFAQSNLDVDGARELTKKLHRITTWSILGPFDNTSGSGHQKDHLGDRKHMASKTYVGKAGQPIKWYNPEVLDVTGYICFENFLARSEGVTAYSGTRLVIENPGTYLLSLTKAGQLSVELDGHEILNCEDETGQLELYHFDATLAEGSHTLLLKVSGEEEAPEVAASLSMPDGSKPQGVSFYPLVPGSTLVRDIEYSRHEIPFVRELRDRVTKDTTDATVTYLWLITIHHFELVDEAREFAPIAARRFSNSIPILYAAASALSITDDEDAPATLLRQAFHQDSTDAMVGLWQAEQLASRGLYAQADSLLENILGNHPDFVAAKLKLLNSYDTQQLNEKIMPLAQSIIDQYPDYGTPYLHLSSLYAGVDETKHRKYLHKSLDRFPELAGAAVRYQEALSEEDLGSAIKQLKKLHELFPDDPGSAIQLAMLRLRNGDETAKESIEEIAQEFPYSYTAQLTRAAIAELEIPYSPEQKQVAIEHYKRALELRPGDFETRDKLRVLMGLEPVSEIIPAADLDDYIRNAPSASDYPGRDACVLLDERRRILFEDGTNYGSRALVIKIFTDKGAENYGTIETGINPLFSDLTIEDAQTVKADGREIEAEQMLGKIAFQNVGPGDFIKLRYHTNTWSIGKLNQEYWDSHIFQWLVPCLVSRYILLAPPEKDFEWKMHNFPSPDSIMTIEQQEDFLVYKWEMTDVPPLESEVQMPDMRTVSPWLDISTIKDWGRIAEWYWDISEKPSDKDPQVEACVTRVLACTDSSSQADTLALDQSQLEAKIRKLFNFVANKVAYEDLSFRYSSYVPEDAHKVLKAMYGDCKDKACLLRSMLRSIGVESYFALVTPITTRTVSYLPSPRFTHLILAIPRDSATYWFIDPTTKAAPARYISESLQGAEALIIHPGTTHLVEIPLQSPDVPFHSIETHASVGATGEIELSRSETIRTADEIAAIRLAYATADDEKRRKRLSSKLGRQYVGLELRNYSWQGLDVEADSVSLSYELMLRNWVSSSGALRLVKLPWRTRLDDDYSMVVANPTRKYPLRLYALQLDEEEQMRVEIPAGWKLQSLPSSYNLKSPFGFFIIEYDLKGHTLIAHRRIRIVGKLVPPDAYPDFKNFIEKAMREQDQVLVFRPSP